MIKPLFLQKALKTQRLILEPVTEAHGGEFFELLKDEQLHLFVPFEVLPLERHILRCARWEKRLSPDGKEIWLNWLARSLSTKQVIGHFQAGIKEGDDFASIGYLVAKRFHNQGYATEGLDSVFEYLRDDFQVTEIRAWIDTRNLASIRLVEKLGMSQIGLIKDADFFKGRTSDEFVYSIKFHSK